MYGEAGYFENNDYDGVWDRMNSNRFFFRENPNMKKILKFIMEKRIEVGERLPAEREMAAALKVGRNSLREAMKVLEMMGVVEIRHGSGTYLKKTDVSASGESAVWLWTHRQEIYDIITVREALDLKAIDLIPEEKYAQVREDLKACVSAAKKTKLDSEKLMLHDLEYHNIIRKASNNDVLLNICIALTGNIYDKRQVLFSQPRYIEQALGEHIQIANAFGTGDVNQVKLAYMAHLASTRFGIENAQMGKEE